MTENKKYKLGSDTYDIPDVEVQNFLKDNPNAIELETFKVDKDVFEIPVTERDAFLKDFPTAQSQKKKDISIQDAFTSASGKEELPFLGQSGKNLVNPQSSSTQPLPSASVENIPSVVPSITPSVIPSEQPKTAKTVGEWVLGTAKAFDESLAGLSGALDYVQTSATDAVSQILFGKETAVQIKKMREEGTLAPALNPKRPFEMISDAINYTHSGAKPLPQNVGGQVLAGTAGVVPDILASMYAPEVQLPRIFGKLGLNVGSKFGMVMGAKSSIEGAKANENQPTLKKVEAPVLGAIEGYMTGWMFDGFSGVSGDIGKSIANKIMPKVATQTQAIDKALIQQGGSMLSNAIFFGGYGNADEYLRTGKISAETFATNAGMGIALGIREPARLLYAKGLNAFIATPKEAINRIVEQKTTTEEFAKEAQDKINTIESGTSADIEGDIAKAKLNANLAGLNAIVDEIRNNKNEVVKSVQNSDLEPKAKEIIVDKINEVDADNDPKIQETKEINDKIAKIDEQLELIRGNKAWDETRKEVESAPLKERREELKQDAKKVYGIEPKEKTEGAVEKPKVPQTESSKKLLDEIEKPKQKEAEGGTETKPTETTTETTVVDESVSQIKQENATKQEEVEKPHLIISSDAKSALDSGRKKQTVVEENGKSVVKEVDFNRDDAELELDRLSILAERGKLTPEEFQKSYFAQTTDINTFKSASERIKSDQVGFISDLKKSFLNNATQSKESIPLVEEKTDGSPKSSLQEQPTITETESEKDNISTGDIQKVEGIQPKLKEEDYELTEDEAWKFEYDLLTSLGLRGTKDYHVINGNTILRVKGHTPNWSNFTEQLNENPNIKRVVNITIGDYNNSDSRRAKTTLDQIQKEFPNIEFIDIEAKDGESLNENIGYLAKTLNQEIIPQESSLEAKQDTTAPIIEKNTEVPPKPPESKIDEQATSGGEKIRTINLRAIESSDVKPEVKEKLKELGVDYVPKGDELTDREVSEIFRLYKDVDGGVDKIESMLTNMNNGIPADTRTALNVELYQFYSDKHAKATAESSKSAYEDKMAELIAFGSEQGTFLARGTRALRRWQDVFGKSPEGSVLAARKAIKKLSDPFFKSNKTNIDDAQKILEDFLKSSDYKKQVESDVRSRLAEERRRPTPKEKIKEADAELAALKEQFKKAWKEKNDFQKSGSMGFAATAHSEILVDLAGKITRAYIKKGYYRAEDVITKVKEYIKDVTGEVLTDEEVKSFIPSDIEFDNKPQPQPQQARKSPQKERKIGRTPVIPKTVEDKIYEKMEGFATRTQLQNFIKRYSAELAEKGIVGSERFKELLTMALNKPFVSEKTIDKIRESAKIFPKYREAEVETHRLGEELAAMLEEKASPDLIKQKRTEYKNWKSKYDVLKTQAENANAIIKTSLTEEPGLTETLTSGIKLGLLTVPSLLKNIYGVGIMGIPKTGASIMSFVVDQLVPGKKVYAPVAFAKGAAKEGFQGLGTGFKELFVGVSETDMGKMDLQREYNPWKAAIRLKDRISGEEQRTATKILGDIIEATPGGYILTFMGRGLNLGDKPVRGIGEGGRKAELFSLMEKDIRSQLKKEGKNDEIAALKRSRAVREELFNMFPNEKVLKEIETAGMRLTYMNPHFLGTLINSMPSTMMQKLKNSDNPLVKQTGEVGEKIAKLGVATTIPYANAPSNLIGEAIDYGVPAFSLLRAAQGAYHGDRRATLEAVGKAAVGVGIIALGQYFIKHNIITTPSEDDDAKERNAQYSSTGKKGYRFNIDAARRHILLGITDDKWNDKDKSVTINGFGSLSMIWMAQSDAYAGKEPLYWEELGYGEKMLNLATGGGKKPLSLVTSSLNTGLLSGTNTALGAMVGGETEQRKWFINTMVAISAPLYPNQAAQISRAYNEENKLRNIKVENLQSGRTIAELKNTFKDRLFMGKQLPAKVSIWGDYVPVIPDGYNPAYMLFRVGKPEKYSSNEWGTRFYEIYEEYKKENPDEARKLLPTLPSGITKVGWDNSKMQPKELEEFQMKVGYWRQKAAQKYVESEEWKNDTWEERIKTLTTYYDNSKKDVEASMFLWNDYRDKSKETKDKWQSMYSNDILPMPTMIKKIGNINLDIEDQEKLNNIAIGFYGDMVQGVAEQINKLPQESKVSMLNGMWNSAIGMAKSKMLPVLMSEGKK